MRTTQLLVSGHNAEGLIRQIVPEKMELSVGRDDAPRIPCNGQPKRLGIDTLGVCKDAENPTPTITGKEGLHMNVAIVLAAVAAVLVFGNTASAVTLDHVKARGFVLCGVSGGLPGFSEQDEHGNWSGIDVDLCRAFAAAMFGEPGKVKYVPVSAAERFEALERGEIDVLSRNTTWTLSRDADGLEFAAVTFYDGQAFMMHKDLGVESVTELNGAAICVTKGTTSEIHLDDYFNANGMTYSPKKYRPYDQVVDAYTAGVCDVMTADRSALHAHRTTLEDPDAHIILPTVISREPLGPVVCQSRCEDARDDRWIAVIRWTLYAMLEAEARGVSSSNVDDMRETSKDRGVQRLLGGEGKLGENLHLPNDWAYNIIKLVGNYAEVYDRNLGPNTPLKIPRGLNALWKDGGIQYPMPFL